MTTELSGWLRTRPIRVAFLVEDGEHSQLVLDGIFADCYARWGGRFSLVVPCKDGRILPEYWPWLEVYDPDIVYSYVVLDDSDVLEIHERLAPADYRYHRLGKEPRLDVFGFRPYYDFAPLSSLSSVFRLARHSPATSGSPRIRIIDSWHTETASRFLTDNLGTYHYSTASGIFPNDALAAAGLLTIVAPEKCEGRRYAIPRDLDMVQSESMALTEFMNLRATSVSLLSAMFAPHLEIRDDRWSNSFNLVVGESFADRLLFWNARLLIPAWLDRDLCCLRVTLEQLREAGTLAQIATLVNRRNHVNSGSGGQAQISVRSATHTLEELTEAVTLLRSAKVWSIVSNGEIVPSGIVVPSSNSLAHTREATAYTDGRLSQSSWRTFPWAPPTARPPTHEPDHLIDAPPRQTFTQGLWAADFGFEYDEISTRFAESNSWALPSRWRFARAFKVTCTSLEQHVLPPVTRRTRNGNLGVFLSTGRAIEAIAVPTSEEAFQFALCRDDCYRNRRDGDPPWPDPKVRWVAESSELPYLRGVLGLAGGLSNARRFLLHPFLQQVFASLGGAPNIALTDISATVNMLCKKSKRQSAFDLRSEDERNSLAELIVKAAKSVRAPMSYISHEDLRARWADYRAHFWASQPQNKKGSSDGADWDRAEEESLDACLVEMRRQHLLFQGYQWMCGSCNHKNWVDLSALTLEPSCEVCKTATITPVSIPSQFRPNEFLIDSLQAHSALSLIWVLSALQSRARQSFIYIGPTCLGYSTDYEAADAEVDLLAIVDGEAIMCEVKSSWRSVRTCHIEDFIALAIKLRPDTAILAVMEEGERHAAQLELAKAELLGRGIKYELLTPKQYKVDGDPYL